MWLFGPVRSSELHVRQRERMAGCVGLQRANVRWFLSVDGSDLPDSARADGRTTFRSITVDGEEIEFTDGFTDLHTASTSRRWQVTATAWPMRARRSNSCTAFALQPRAATAPGLLSSRSWVARHDAAARRGGPLSVGDLASILLL